MKIFGIFLALLVIALIGCVIYLGIADVSVPQTPVTKDVSAAPASVPALAPAPETPAKTE